MMCKNFSLILTILLIEKNLVNIMQMDTAKKNKIAFMNMSDNLLLITTDSKLNFVMIIKEEKIADMVIDVILHMVKGN